MSEYKAIVAKIDRVVPIPGADNIHTAYVLGEQVIVGKRWGEGKVGLFFPVDCQLSGDFCKQNNLYRDSTLNIDQEKKGFFELSRRVRCQPFLKVKSEGFFCELSSLDYLENFDTSKLKVGDSFSEINGVEICKKYYNEKTLRAIGMQGIRKVKKAEAFDFYKHTDTQHFKYYVDKIPKGALINIHAKVHGTSFRCSHSLVKRSFVSNIDALTVFLKKIKLRKITQKEWYVSFCNKVNSFYTWLSSFNKTDWEYLVGTRNVILFEEQKTKIGFHGSEQYRFDVMEELKPYLEKGMIIYGEIAGFVNGKPLMGSHNIQALKNKEYTRKYGKAPFTFSYTCGEANPIRWHIYRISYINGEGKQLDFTEDQIQAWCERHDFLGPLRVYDQFIYDGNRDALVELVEALTERPECLTEDYIDDRHISEGVIIRVDAGEQVPAFYKNKSYAFKVIEGIIKESGEEDIEEVS